VYAKKNGIEVDMPSPAALKLPDLPPLAVSSDDSGSESDDSSETAKAVVRGGVDVELETDDDDDVDDDDDDEADDMSAGNK
jgi:hypothetical protein